MQKLVYWHDDGSAKVWYVHYDSDTGQMTTRWGKQGATLQESAKPSSFEAYQKTIRSKERKGYQHCGSHLIGDVLDMPNQPGDPASPAPSAKKFTDGVLLWTIHKSNFDEAEWMQKVTELFGEGSIVSRDSKAIKVRVGESELQISSARALMSGMLKIDEWEIGLLLLKLASRFRVDLASESGETVTKRHALKQLFNDPKGFDELSEQLGLVPKMTANHRDAVVAFF